MVRFRSLAVVLWSLKEQSVKCWIVGLGVLTSPEFPLQGYLDVLEWQRHHRWLVYFRQAQAARRMLQRSEPSKGSLVEVDP
jgi:hypothetical protein